MKLFKYQMGSEEKLGVAKNEKEAYEKRTDVDHTYAFLPVQISEVTLEGYDITLTPTTKAEEIKEGVPEPSHIVHTLDRDGLKTWLDEHNIEFTPQWGEKKLRELALENV